MIIKKPVPKNPVLLKELIVERLRELQKKAEEDEKRKMIEMRNYLMFR